MIFNFYPNVSITKEQGARLKKALRSGKWQNLKTWKEKFLFQCFTHDQKSIIAIGLKAKKLNASL
jgi:hypothetical protein